MRRGINTRDLRHEDGRILLPPENVANGPSHVGRRKGRGRDLIEKRLKAMVVMAVDHRDLRPRARERLGSFHACKASAHDDDVGVGCRRRVHYSIRLPAQIPGRLQGDGPHAPPTVMM